MTFLISFQMAQFTPLVTSAEFTPTSYDDYMKPHLLAEAAYQTRRQALDQSADALSAYLPYLNDATPEARKLYDDAQQQLERNVTLLGTKGWNLNPEPLIAFKDQYRKTNSILKKAATSLEEQQKADKEAMAKDGSLFVRYKNKSGEFIQPNIDSMITNDYSRHLVSGNDIQANSMAAAQALSSRVKAAFSSFAKIGQTTGYYSSKNGTMAGVPNAVLMDWLMTPERYQEDINSWLKNVRARGGKHAEDTMRSLFNGEIAKALEDVVGRTDYDNMEQSDQVRLNKYLMTGVYQGLKYDESYQVNNTPFDDSERDGGGRHGDGGEVEPHKLEEAQEKPQVYISDLIDSDEYEAFKNMKKWFGIDDSNYGTTGQITFRDRLALNRGERPYNDSKWWQTEDYTGADDFINGMSQEDLDKYGITDYFDLFNNEGGLFTRQQFRELYGPRLEKMNRDYAFRHGNNPDYGNAYKKQIWSAPIRDADDADEIYDNIQDAILGAFNVPKAEKNKIKDDKSGQQFDKFIEEHNVNKATLMEQFLRLEDTYTNTERNLMIVPFESKNQQIVNNALLPFKIANDGDDGDATFRMKKISGYKFKMNGSEKQLYTECSDMDDYTIQQVFGSDTNYTNVVFALPPDLSEGVIMKTDTGDWLLPAKELGTQYPWKEMQRSSDAINRCQQEIRKLEGEKVELSIDYSKVQMDGSLSDSERENKLKEIKEKYDMADKKKAVVMETISTEYSNVIKTFRHKFGLLQKQDTSGK